MPIPSSINRINLISHNPGFWSFKGSTIGGDSPETVHKKLVHAVPSYLQFVYFLIIYMYNSVPTFTMRYTVNFSVHFADIYVKNGVGSHDVSH